MSDSSAPSSSDSSPPQSSMAGVEIIRAALREMPSSSGVYRMLGEGGDVLYIGKAKQLKNRVSNYANIVQLPTRLQRMVHATRKVETTLTASEAEALLLEANLIKTHKPRYNILLKDDKSYPYIHLSTDQEYPRISKYRGPKDKKGDYFGPFVSGLAVNEAITTLQKAFLLRPCSDTIFRNRTRPCLQYQIKRCSAPCVRKVTPAEYAALLAQAKRFLTGRNREIQDQLSQEMQEASERQDYELAARLRDRIRALTHVQALSSQGGIDDADVIALARNRGQVCVQVFAYRGGSNYGNRAFFPAHAEDVPDAEVMAGFLGQYYQRQPVPRQVMVSHEPAEADVLQEALSMLAKHRIELITPQRGEKKAVIEQAVKNAREALLQHELETMQNAKLLSDMAELFGLPEAPARIEVYDNSHVSGMHAVGAMIVAGPEGFNKKAYRTFNIKSAELTPGDDYAMLREVLTRRFRHMLEAEDDESPSHGMDARPDLILIDGGKGQLSAACEVFSQLGISDVPYAAIAKGPDRNAGREWFHLPEKEPFQLPRDAPVLHYLQRLRDEAHRFAIGTHRNRRSKAVRVSQLDAIEAIGPARKKALLHFFGSAREVGAASLAELEKVPGISKEIARKIYAHFHGE